MQRSGDWGLVAAAVVALGVWFVLRNYEPSTMRASAPNATVAAQLPTLLPTAQQVQAPSEGAVAPALALETLDGEQVSLADYRGQVVLVNFWATWCGPCQYEIPELLQARDGLADLGFEILAVNVGEDAEAVRAFADAMGMTFPVLLDGDMAGARAYALRGIPASFLVDQEGIIRKVHVGILTEASLREYVKALLGTDA